jgi:hypothetical protein
VTQERQNDNHLDSVAISNERGAHDEFGQDLHAPLDALGNLFEAAGLVRGGGDTLAFGGLHVT